MNMIEVKTDDLIGPALDWAVCLAHVGVELMATEDYSTEWAQGGPLIDEYEICLICLPTGCSVKGCTGSGIWSAKLRDLDTDYHHLNPTPLIAACRAIVRARLGDTVQIPAELLP